MRGEEWYRSDDDAMVTEKYVVTVIVIGLLSGK